MAIGKNTHIFKISLGSDYPEWWRYNLFLTLVGYDDKGKIVCYCSDTDRIYDIESPDTVRNPHAGAPTLRVLSAESQPCERVEIFAYAIANTFPESSLVRESPPFPAYVLVEKDGKQIERLNYEVNQWGGLTVIGHKVGSNDSN